MVAEAQNQAAKLSTRRQLETFLGVAGIALAVVYGLGFLILSLYDAKFGILEFDPLRARIFQAGFLFVCLLVLPVAAMHYGFTRCEGLSPLMQPAEPGLEARRKIILLSAFIYTAWIMAFYLGIWLLAPAPIANRPWYYGVTPVAAMVFFLFSFSAIGKRFPKNANRCSVLAVLSALSFGLALDRFGSPSTSALSGWFFLVGVVSFAARDSEDLLREALHWVNWLLVLCLMAFYGTSVYARIEPKFGGGAPMPIVVYLNRPLPWSTSKDVTASLLEETSQGYFVSTPRSGNALFIPRSDVAAIYFGSSDSAPRAR